MLKWLKDKKITKAKAEAMRLGTQATDLANEAMSEWEAISLQLRKQELIDGFDERLTQIKVSDQLSFPDAAEIESLALMKNWIEHKEKVVSEIANYIDPESWEILKILEASETYIERLYETFDEVGQELATELLISTNEEELRRLKID